MRALLALLVSCLVAAFVHSAAGNAARDAAAPPESGLELLVFELEDCTYCQVFRRDVLPQYRQSAPAKVAPLRFVDIDKTDPESLALNSRIDVIPTAVLMKDGREVDRIPGYWGPSNFFKMLSYMLERVVD